MIKWRNAERTTFGTFICEVECGSGDWGSYHATPDDPDESGSALYSEIKEAFDSLKEYVSE